MEHPLIENISDLTEEQLGEAINDLNKKLSIATRSGNGHLCHQLRMAIESYSNKYQEKIRANITDNQTFANKINIQ
jgi:aromatic ring-opening dioxygenase catalytic subunit (LigB family)